MKAIKLLSSGKAPRSNAKPAEIYKAGGPPVAEKLAELFHIMWRKEAIPQEFKDATNISKGKRILKSVTIIKASLYCQLLGRSLLGSYWIDWMNTLNSQGFYQKASVDSGKTEEQQTWSLQHDSSKENTRNKMWTSTWPLSTLPKHSQSWGILENYAKFVCPGKFIAMVRQFHDGMLARVQNDGEFSDPFPVTNGV